MESYTACTLRHVWLIHSKSVCVIHPCRAKPHTIYSSCCRALQCVRTLQLMCLSHCSWAFGSFLQRPLLWTFEYMSSSDHSQGDAREGVELQVIIVCRHFPNWLSVSTPPSSGASYGSSTSSPIPSVIGGRGDFHFTQRVTCASTHNKEYESLQKSKKGRGGLRAQSHSEPTPGFKLCSLLTRKARDNRKERHFPLYKQVCPAWEGLSDISPLWLVDKFRSCSRGLLRVSRVCRLCQCVYIQSPTLF